MHFNIHPAIVLPDSLRVLFPRLNILDVFISDFENIGQITPQVSFILGAVGSGFHSFTLGPMVTRRLLRDVTRSGIQLRKLDLLVGDSTIAILSELLSKALCLQQLILRADMDVGARLWGPLSVHPSLATLRLDITEAPSFNPTSVRNFTFATLVELQIDVADATFYLPLFRASRFPVLETLECAFLWRKQLAHAEVSEITRVIAIACSLNSLKSIAFISAHKDDDYNEDFIRADFITADALRPLLSFSHIQDFRLAALWSFDLDDAFVLEMSRAWPKLRTLDLGCDGDWPSKSSFSLSGLKHLAFYCSQLESLRVAVNATHTPPTIHTCTPYDDLGLRAQEGDRVENRLISLQLGRSPICHDSQSSADVAEFLTKEFPNLRRISLAYCYGGYVGLKEEDLDDCMKGWLEVARHVNK